MTLRMLGEDPKRPGIDPMTTDELGASVAEWSQHWLAAHGDYDDYPDPPDFPVPQKAIKCHCRMCSFGRLLKRFGRYLISENTPGTLYGWWL